MVVFKGVGKCFLVGYDLGDIVLGEYMLCLNY